MRRRLLTHYKTYVKALLLIALGGGGIIVVALTRQAGPERAVPREVPAQRRAGPYIVYAKPSEEWRTEVRCRRLESGEDRLVYISAESRWHSRVPDALGFLPSPDGGWLLVWDTQYDLESGLPDVTRWALVSLWERRTVDLGESRGEAAFLPRWEDHQHVRLIGDESAAVFDVAAGRQAGGLPMQIMAGHSEEALLEYSRRYHAQDKECLSCALTRLEAESKALASVSVRMEPDGYIVLRSSGIPGLDKLRPLRPPWARPSAACSPDGSLVACAGWWQYLPSPRDIADGAPVGDIAFGGGLGIVEVASGTLVWHLEVAPRYLPGRVPDYHVNPPVSPWTSPTFRDLRWSHDGRYLSWTLHDDPSPRVIVVDTTSWREVLRIPDAMNAFVLADAP